MKYPGQMEDQHIAEEAIERALYDLRSDEPMAAHSRDKRKKTIHNELFFLKENHPDSYILQDDFDLSYPE